MNKPAACSTDSIGDTDVRILLKITSISIIIAMLFPLSVGASSPFLDTKMVGKLTMIAVLSVTAFLVKALVQRDKKEAVELHEKLGMPDRSMEFREGFDHWRMEWYGDRVYIFRNGVLHKRRQQRRKNHTEPIREKR